MVRMNRRAKKAATDSGIGSKEKLSVGASNQIIGESNEERVFKILENSGVIHCRETAGSGNQEGDQDSLLRCAGGLKYRLSVKHKQQKRGKLPRLSYDELIEPVMYVGRTQGEIPLSVVTFSNEELSKHSDFAVLPMSHFITLMTILSKMSGDTDA